jgi:hypothetical protein
MHAPLSMVQTLHEVLVTVNIESPSAENAADPIAKAWPANVGMHAPCSQLQSLAVLSLDAVKTKVSSPLNAAVFTQSKCPAKV